MIFNKTKTLDFREFLAGANGSDQRKYTNISIYKNTMFSPFIITPSALLHPSPLVLKGYLIVLSAGVILIGAACLEKYFATVELKHIASTIFQVVEALLPFVLVGALIIFVYNNPLL
jgi:hypothetical protein